MAAQGYTRTAKQCREKLKKMKSDYRAIKDHNGRSGVSRKEWKWYERMDAIYGHRPASQGREFGLDTATQMENADDSFFISQRCASTDRPETPASPVGVAESSESEPTPLSATSAGPSPKSMSRSIAGKRKRSSNIADLASVMAQNHAEDMRIQERMLEMRERMHEQRQRMLEMQHEQRERHQQMLQDREAAELTERSSFHGAFISHFASLVEALKGPHL
ncbi:uncharacterized protein KZ484_022283 [Pholidichthys leucotaenia]